MSASAEREHQCILEDRMTKCETRICDLDKLQALQTLSFQNIEKSVAKMEANISKGVWILLGIVIVAVVKMVMK